MNFLKDNKEYLAEEAKGFISNTFRFTIKDLYKKDAHRIDSEPNTIDCQFCGVFLTGETCLYCGKPNKEGIKQSFVKNWSTQRETEEQEKSVECMIIMVDLSGSMNITYPSRYPKVNKEYAIRALGSKTFQILRNAIGEPQVLNNFKSISMLLQAGQTPRDIAFSIKQQLLRAKQKLPKVSNTKETFPEQYISRKEIIEVGITQYINTIKTKRPNTIMTVVYFNSNIQYPVDNFSHCNVVGNLEEKTLEQLLEAGREAAEHISLSSIQEIGEKLLSNLTKAEADGQTAMTPALAFCLGMASKWRHDLNQIVIVTDGLSNVGIGQTEQPQHLQASKKLYEQLSVKYAIKSNCVVNIISFEDCAIGYDVIDEVIKRTGGVPYSIGFKEENKQKIVDHDTINFLNFEMTTGFCESTKQFCFDNKMSVKISSPNLTIKVPQDLHEMLKIKQKNWVSLDLGVKSVNESFQFAFILDPDFKIENTLSLKITVLHQYRRSKKISFIVRQDIIKIRNGDPQESLQSQGKILKKQIEQKLKKKFQDSSYDEYQSLSRKLQKIEVVQTIDKDILQRFNKKKVMMEEYDKNVDTITQDKRRIQSRRKETYNKRKYSQEDIFQ